MSPFSRIAAVCILSATSLLAQRGGTPAPTPQPAPVTPNPIYPSIDYRESSPTYGPKHDPNFTIKVNSQIVTVDIVAVDSKGMPVTDLKPEEITVQEDGKKRPISNFALEQRGQGNSPLLTRLQEQAKSKPPSVVTNFAGNIQSAPQNGCTILLVDALNTAMPDQAFSRDHLTQFLNTLDPNQPVAIYVLGDTLRLMQDFTTDKQQLLAAVSTYAKNPVMLQPRSSYGADYPLSTTMRPPSSLSPNGGLSTGAQLETSSQDVARFMEAELVGAETEARVLKTADSLAALARHIAMYSGRKNLIWLSGGFPFETAGGILATDGRQTYSSGDPRNYYTAVDSLAKIMANANIAVYPVDARGLMSGAFDAGFKGWEHGHFNAMDGRATAYNSQLSQNEAAILNPQMTMITMADMTGGRAFINNNDIRNELTSAMKDGSAYYEAAFRPGSASADGSYHTINVKTSRKGVKLRFRKGYYALDGRDRDAYLQGAEQFMVEHALLDQRTLSTGLPMMAQVDASNPRIIDFWIHGGSITILDDTKKNQPMVRMEIAVATFDNANKMLTKNSVIVATNLRAEDINTVLNDGLSQNLKFERKPEAARLRVAVRDIPSGKIGTIDIPLTQPMAQNAAQPEQK